MKGKGKGVVKTIFKYIGIVVLWVVVFAAALYTGRYMNSIYGYAAFFLLLLLLIISLIILAVLRHRIAVESNLPEGTTTVQCKRGEPLDLNLKIKNRSIFFCLHAKAGFFISDLFGGTDAEMQTDFTLAARSDSLFDFGMDMKHIGMYQVGLRDMQIFDMFGFFHRQVRLAGEYTVCVNPRIRSMEDMIVEEEVFFESSKDTRVTTPSGMDYVGVRDYEPGDPMKQIHWKLSAHTISYLTKLSESTRQSEYVVALDFSANEADREELMDLYDALIETAFSLLEELTKREVTYSLIYLDKQGELCRSVPQGRENDMEFIRRFGLITQNPDPEYIDGARIIQEEATMPNRSTNLLVCSSRITTDLIQELISVKQQRRSPELYLIYPQRLTQREREDLTAPLRLLDEMKIPWHPLSTAINLQKEEDTSEQPSGEFNVTNEEGGA